MRSRLLAALLAAGIALGALLSAAGASANAVPPGNGAQQTTTQANPNTMFHG
jgi:hypothetical protein